MNRNTLTSILRTTAKTLAWAIGSLTAILIVIEIALCSPVLTKAVNSIAKDYVDGDLSFGKASFSVFRRFPAVVLTLEDVSVTYPAERFDSLERAGVQGHLMYAGCAQDADTLASFKRFSVGVSVPALIGGTIKVPYMRLDRPRIFAHAYCDGSANWDMFSTGEEQPEETVTVQEEDTTDTSGMPKIAIGRIMMTGRPHIVYTDSRDSIFALVGLRRLELNGNINSKHISRSRIGLTLDSLFVAGRIVNDTLAVGIDRLYMHEKDRNVNIEMNSKAFIATRDYGRIRVPMNVSGIMAFPKDSILTVDFRDLKADIAHIPLTGQANIRIADDKTFVKAELGIEKWNINTLLHSYVSHIIAEAGQIKTDAELDINLNVDGVYDHTTGQLPQMTAQIVLPDSHLTYDGLPGQQLCLGLLIGAEVDKKGLLNVDIRKAKAEVDGLKLSIQGGLQDLLGEDPALSIDANADADLDQLQAFLPDSLGIQAQGHMSAKIGGTARMSQLDIYNFSTSSLKGEVLGNGIKVNMPQDTISAVLDGIKITLGPDKRVSRRDSTKVLKLIGISGEIAKADINYKDAMKLKADNFSVSAKNALDSKGAIDTTRKIHPFRGTISAKGLSFRDSDGTSMRLTESFNSFNVFPKRGQPETPVLTLSSRNKRMMFRYDVNRGGLNDVNFRVTASMNTFLKRKKMNAFMDSLARIYPYIPKDSLMRHHMTVKRASLPSYAMEQDEFKDENIDISLDKSLAKHFREWDLNGKLTVGNSYLMTPLFPLKNNLKGFQLSFTNDRIGIDSLQFSSGESQMSAQGELTGLKRALLGRRGSLKLNVDVLAEKMNADELMAAYTTGANYSSSDNDSDINTEVEDEEYMAEILLDSSAVSAAPSLIVVPGNLNADIKLFAGNIDYSNLHVDLITTELLVKDRCLRITNTQALTNMGYIDMEGFYSTRSKNDLKTGFSMNFKDITAEKVISLMPAVDTLMPLLKSFGGMLNCEVAATAALDTNMNIIMPSINGIMRMGGENLYIKDNEMFSKMAKLLVFKNKEEGHIDKMTVEGVIKDNKVEVFPFIIEMDRYMLGFSGVQNMDMSFRYHASLIKSPLLVKVGMDIYGTDFDNMKFKIGKPKYKSKDVPVFSTVINDTKINLVHSIRSVFDKGVDAVIKENDAYNVLEKHKNKIGYVQAVDQNMEELSEQEQQQYDAQQQEQ